MRYASNFISSSHEILKNQQAQLMLWLFSWGGGIGDRGVALRRQQENQRWQINQHTRATTNTKTYQCGFKWTFQTCSNVWVYFGKCWPSFKSIRLPWQLTTCINIDANYRYLLSCFGTWLVCYGTLSWKKFCMMVYGHMESHDHRKDFMNIKPYDIYIF